MEIRNHPANRDHPKLVNSISSVTDIFVAVVSLEVHAILDER